MGCLHMGFDIGSVDQSTSCGCLEDEGVPLVPKKKVQRENAKEVPAELKAKEKAISQAKSKRKTVESRKKNLLASVI